MNMKKVVTKNNIIYILMFSSLFAMSLYMNIYARSLIDLSAYGFTGSKYYTYWLGFSFSWIILMLVILYLIPRTKKIITYLIINIFWNIIFVAQICYVQQLGKFMIFSDLFLAGEGLQYVKSVLFNLNPGMIFTTIFSIICMVLVIILHRNNHIEFNKPKKKIAIILIGIALLIKGGTYIGLGTSADANTWQENYTPKNIYSNFTNPNTSMLISGFYEYTARAVYKYFYNLITFDKVTLKTTIDKYNNIYGIEYKENEYTGIFKGKNVIYIMMESIDSWIIDQDTMPTLKYMMDTGLNFTNRYSPFFNGGQTINSEFACNTGMYAISEADTIYDIDNVDYKYSLANMLKNNGYNVNSFHANTGSFYNRNTFHKELGYKHHYSMQDMQNAGILDKNKNYFSDSVMFNDSNVFNLMTSNEPFLSFITTYSAHLEYSNDNKVYKSIKHPLNSKKYGEEEYVYRTLAHDTDEALKKLLKKLEKNNQLDNIVIVLVSDHYVYGYSDSDYVAIKKNVLNDRKELQNTPFVIWSKDLESKNIDTILDTADILPTLLNMLGITYDPNKYMGTDVFSESHDDFVWFSDGTYIKSKDSNLSNEAILTKINYNISKNKNILLTNYYGK